MGSLSKYTLVALVPAVLILAIFPWDTDGTQRPIWEKYGYDIGERTLTSDCTTDGFGVQRTLFGVAVTHCDTAWFVLFNLIPFQIAGDDIEGSEKYSLTISADDIPDGWYEHQLRDTHSMLTRSETLPDIDAEAYAYGEFISISVLPFDGDPMRPEEWRQLAWINDEAMVHSASSVTVGGLPGLRVYHKAAGASGDQISYYLFTDDLAHSFTLYPADSGYDEDLDILIHRHVGRLVPDSPEENTYTNTTHGFSFAYPAHWHEGENNGDDFLQLYNYDVSQAAGGHDWPEDHNKIEGVVTADDVYGTSSDSSEESREETVVTIAGREVKRTDVVFIGGNHIRTYAVPLHTAENEFLAISIYGDPENFHVLDGAIQNMQFSAE